MHPLQVIVETPKGSHFKYRYNPKKEWFEVSKSLPAGLAFPYDFGAIEGTKGEDGDPLDVLIFSEFSFLQGTRLRCDIIGAMKAEQSSNGDVIRNDRIFVIPDIPGLNPVYRSLSDLQDEKLKEIENFFVYYNSIQSKTFKPLGILSPKETWKLIKQQRS